VGLTIEEAGVRYLETVCPANKAEKAYYKTQQKYDEYVSYDQPPSEATKKAAKAASDAEATAAVMLTDPGFLWPKEVRADVQDVATGLYETSAWYEDVAKAKSWNDVRSFPKVSNRDAASTVRLLLGLPPRGECPKEYR
jgi:carbohydrate-selective porin OprB